MERKRLRIFTEDGSEGYLAKLTAFVPDKPGSLAEMAGRFAEYGINITYFHYNRSEHPNRVLLELTGSSKTDIEDACGRLATSEEPPSPGMELGLVDMRNLLNIEVGLEHRPGTLGIYAELLRNHGANVIYMSYNEDVSESSARFSIAAPTAEEVDLLLKDMNTLGYRYSIIYKGAGQKEVEDIIGLNLVERFFLKMKGLLGTEDIKRLKGIVDSSVGLTSALSGFSKKAGRDLEAGGVFTDVLAFAAESLMRTGKNFSYRRLPVLKRDGLTMHAFRPPTGGNIYIIGAPGDWTMIDGTYGIYHEDVKRMLSENGIDPAFISRIYLSHADSDHAGMSGAMAKELGCPVYLHRSARGIISKHNRAWGSDTPYIELNGHFTRVVNEFTSSTFPKKWKSYKKKRLWSLGGFPVVDSFTVCGAEFLVLESLGGHVPGVVFFASPDAGLFFTCDYMLLLESLAAEEKEVLSYPKHMMISTNVDSALFRQEMEMLTDLLIGMNWQAGQKGMEMIVAPGHGDWYPASRLEA